MYKQKIEEVHIILFSNKMEWNIDTCYEVNEPQKCFAGNSLAVQQLGLQAFTTRGLDSIPGQEATTSHAAQPGKKKSYAK